MREFKYELCDLEFDPEVCELRQLTTAHQDIEREAERQAQRQAQREAKKKARHEADLKADDEFRRMAKERENEKERARLESNQSLYKEMRKKAGELRAVTTECDVLRRKLGKHKGGVAVDESHAATSVSEDHASMEIQYRVVDERRWLIEREIQELECKIYENENGRPIHEAFGSDYEWAAAWQADTGSQGFQHAVFGPLRKRLRICIRLQPPPFTPNACPFGDD